MSILRTLNTGASGLSAHGEALGVVSDNIANANTIGYKRSRAVFQDVLGMAAAQSSGSMAGAGSRIGHIQAMWQQGALLTTDQTTDLAISGKGFFMVNGKVDGELGNYYTRAGQFQVDADGYMVNPDGMKLQGYMADGEGNINGSISDLRVGGGTMMATPSSDITLSVNLNSNEQILEPWDPANPAETSNFSSGTTVYDSLGNAHSVTIYYRKVDENNWEYHAMADGNEVVGGVDGVPVEGASGTLTFSTDGSLESDVANGIGWDFKGAAPGQVVNFDFGQSIADGGDGKTGTTQMGAPSSTNGVAQNGSAGGSVVRISIGGDGLITGVFSNGQRRTLGQVAVADFQSEDGLARAGAGMWAETRESGAALVGGGEAGGRGSIVSGALEQSNVDIGREFVDLIAYQRGFQANSKVVQTADEMYGELVNMRR